MPRYCCASFEKVGGGGVVSDTFFRLQFFSSKNDHNGVGVYHGHGDNKGAPLPRGVAPALFHDTLSFITVLRYISPSLRYASSGISHTQER